MKSFDTPNIKVTLIRSYAGKNFIQRRIFVSLGLKKIGKSRILANNNCVLGQINKVIQFVKVEPAA